MPIIKDNNNLFTLDKNASGAQRKMAAIFAADVVGYSKLMEQNEKLTLFRLKETRKTTDAIIKKLNGRIFSTAGDSIMAEFASPVDAVEAAIEIQQVISQSVTEIKDNILIEFRIGINLGDIMVQDNNLYGDNVNIAARLESISKVGEICISEKVFQEIKNKVDVKFKFLGTKKLKNISEKINIYISTLTEKNDDSLKKSFLSKKVLIIFSVLLFLIISCIVGYKYFFTESINYNQGSQSVIETLKKTEDITISNTQETGSAVKVSIMKFQNQSTSFTPDSLSSLMERISFSLTEKDVLTTVITPEGSENLNPPEVMLIATESNSSFVINGIIYSDEGNNFLNIKIYEAKRGSMIVSKKFNLDAQNNFNNVTKFISLFKKDIIS